MSIPKALMLCAALTCGGCGDDLSTPTSPSTSEATLATELFSGVLQVKGTRFYSYRVSSAGTVTAMLATLTTGTGAPVQRPLELGVGIPAGTGCALRQVAHAGPALVPQVSLSVEAGIYCVNVADIEGLPASMNFAIRIVHP